MEAFTAKLTEPQGLSMFQLFVLYVGASQLVNGWQSFYPF
jgi:hypothetical protein